MSDDVYKYIGEVTKKPKEPKKEPPKDQVEIKSIGGIPIYIPIKSGK